MMLIWTSIIPFLFRLASFKNSNSSTVEKSIADERQTKVRILDSRWSLINELEGLLVTIIMVP